MASFFARLRDRKKVAKRVKGLFNWRRNSVRALQNVNLLRQAHNHLYSRLRPVKDREHLEAKYADIMGRLREDGYYTIERFLDEETVAIILRELSACQTEFIQPHWEVYQ